MSASCCNCCGMTSLVGVVFFGITAVMVKRENKVFLAHKAGMNLHTVTDEQINEKFMAMIYTMIVSFLPPFVKLKILICLGVRGGNDSVFREWVWYEST